MLFRIVKHEWRALSADATVWVIAGVFAVAIGYGVWNGARWVHFQQAALADAAAEESGRYARIQDQLVALSAPGAAVSPFADPRSPTNIGGRMGPRYATLPPGPLAPLAIGQSDLLPYYFKVSTDARENLISAMEIENPLRLLAGRFDLAFVIIFLFPLLILAVTYSMLSAEKEQGTLALALSQPLAVGRLVAGKVALRAGLLLGLVVVFSVAASLLTGANLGAPGALGRFALWIGLVGAYGLFWFALSVWVAARGWNSTTNATALAAAWLVLVVMTPALFNLIVTTIYPVPSRVEMVQAIREATDQASKSGSKALARYYEDHPELATGDPAQAMNDFNIVRVAVNEDVERRVRPVVQHYESQIASQQRTIDALRFLSPAILMQSALNDVAGTGSDRHRHFLAQVDRFHQQWRQHFVSLIFAKAQIRELGGIPAFRFDEEATSSVARRVLTGAAGLVVLAAVLSAFAVRRLRHFPVVG